MNPEDTIVKEDPIEHVIGWDLTMEQLGRVVTVRGCLMHPNGKDVLAQSLVVSGHLHSYCVEPPTGVDRDHGMYLRLDIRGATVRVTSDVVMTFSGPYVPGHKEHLQSIERKRAETDAALQRNRDSLAVVLGETK